MGKRNVEIVLEDGAKSFIGGGVVRGEVVVRVEKGTTCKSLMVSVGWSTHGRGNRASADVMEENLFIGDWTPGEYRYPFEATLPHGPYTYNGHYLNVGWYVEARADVPWALDPKDEVEIALVPSDDPLPATHPSLDVSGLDGMDMTPKLALIICGVAFAIASGVVGMGFLFDEFVLFVFAGIVAIGGLFMAGVALKIYMTKSKLGEVVFELEPVETWAGGQVLASLEFTPRTSATINAITATLSGKESVVSGSGTNRTTYSHSLMEVPFTLLSAGELRAGEPVRLEQMIEVPRDAPFSFDASDNTLKWSVTCHVDVARWPDWRQSRVIWVGAKRASGW